MKLLFCRKIYILTIAAIIISYSLFAQSDSIHKFTHADTLRGMLTPARSCYDVTFYDLRMNIDLKKHSIKGSNTICFDVINDFDSLQVDLFARMRLEKVMFHGEELPYRRELNAIFIRFPVTVKKGDHDSITIDYSGVPQVAKSPPWDGGFVWKKDVEDRDWAGVACQGTGASLWWPCKDHLSDEPDSMSMIFTIPTGFTCVSNGNLRDTYSNADGTTTWKWFVSYPINNYNVTVDIAHYAHFTDFYISGNDTLDLDYYVLQDNLKQAIEHFGQVKTMLSCFEKYFGRYPFWRDGYALVETNYWGMEHQGAIAYGNSYQNNKQGFDFIIIHESAHEWWGNNVSCRDEADLWIHESFATYSEALYLEYTQGFDAYLAYLIDQRWQISDKHPIIGPYDVNFRAKDNDLYYKGSWMLHTFRNVLNNDSLFFSILKKIQWHFALETITSDQLISYINKLAGADYSLFFDQYLRYSTPPVLQYKANQKGKDTKVEYRWKTDVPQFSMPVEVVNFYEYSFGTATKKFILIHPISEWQMIMLPEMSVKNFDVNVSRFYVKKEEVK